jgi:hypothetical protein
MPRQWCFVEFTNGCYDRDLFERWQLCADRGFSASVGAKVVSHGRYESGAT